MKLNPIIAILSLLLAAQSQAQTTSEDSSAIVPDQQIQAKPAPSKPRPAPARPAPSRPEPTRPAPAPHTSPAPRPAPQHPAPAPSKPHPTPARPNHPAPTPRPAPSHPVHPTPGHGSDHVGWHDGGPRPGFRGGWQYDRNHRPGWFNAGIIFPAFEFAAEIGIGDWQCTAFDQSQNPYSAAAPTEDEAQYNALYDCGGPNYAADCYIPDGYCNLNQ